MKRIRRFLSLWWPVGVTILAIAFVAYGNPAQMQVPFLMLSIIFAFYAAFVRHMIQRRDREISRLRQQLGNKDVETTLLRDEIRRHEEVVAELQDKLNHTLRRNDDDADPRS